MQPDQSDIHPPRLSLSDFIPAALVAAGVFAHPLLAHATFIHILAGLAGGATFFAGTLIVLRRFGTSLVPAVLASAASGAMAGLVYWLLGRPDLTAIGTAGLGAVGGAVVAPFELVWVEFRLKMAQLETQSDFEYTGFLSTLWSFLIEVVPRRRGQHRRIR
jgi:uncharacterized MnhB-related membrane protein